MRRIALLAGLLLLLGLVSCGGTVDNGPVVTVETVCAAEDRPEQLNLTYDTVRVELPGNEAAEERINADLALLAEEAAERCEKMIRLCEGGDGFDSYYFRQQIRLMRADRAVISFRICRVYYYAGAAHGGYTYSGVTYDAKTGDRLTLDMLGEEAWAEAIAQATALAEVYEAFYREEHDGLSCFDDYRQDIPKLLVNDERFYLTEDGLTFANGAFQLSSSYGTSEPLFFTVGYDGVSEAYRMKKDDIYILDGEGHLLYPDGTAAYDMDRAEQLFS